MAKRARAKGTGSIFKPKGSRFYWISYVSGGKRRYEGTKSERKKDAQDRLTDRLGDTGKGFVINPKVGRLKLADGLKAVTDNLKMNGRKSGDETQRRIDLHVLTFFSADRWMSTISTSDIEKYKAHRLEQKAKAATVNRELAAIRRAFRLAMQSGDLVAMPHVSLLAEHNRRVGFFERSEFDAILAHLPAHLQAPLRFAYVTGWRFKSEVLPLTASQVDLRAGTVRLEVGSTKSGAGRTFFVTKELRAVLQAQIDSLDALKKRGVIASAIFHRPDGSPIKDMRTAWEAARTAAGYPDRIFHDLRRTAVRNLEQAGVPRSTAMAMVGHETESIYRRYAITDAAMLAAGAAKLDAWAAANKAKATAERRRGQLARFRGRKTA